MTAFRTEASPSAARRTICLGAKRKLLAFLLALMAGALRLFNHLFGPRAVGKKVVLLEPFGMGDIISLEPLVRRLLERGYEVVLCGHSAWRGLYPPRPGFEWIDAGLPWATHDEKAKYRLSAYLAPAFRQFLGRFRSLARGGVGVDTRGDIRSAIALYLAGCPRVASLSHYLGSDVAVPGFAAGTVPFDPGCRRWELNLKFLTLLDPGGGADRIAPPSFPHLKAASRPDERIGLVAMAPWAGKLWVPARWQELIEALRQEGFEARSYCGPGQEGRAAEQAAGAEVACRRSMEEWAEELSVCRLVVALDTGPMHLADALGVPVIALFGTGLLPLWAPSGPRSVVISHQDEPDFAVCQPVEANTGWGRKFMEKISADEAIEAARAILKDR